MSRQPTDSAVSLQYLLQWGGEYLRLLQLKDELLVPGIEQAKADASKLPSAKGLRSACTGQVAYMDYRRWTFFALAALYFPSHKGHGIFQQLPFFQNAEAARCVYCLFKPTSHTKPSTCDTFALKWLHWLRKHLDVEDSIPSFVIIGQFQRSNSWELH